MIEERADLEAEEVDFGPLRVAFDDRVLRPRPWTRSQSHLAAGLLAEVPPGPVLELCAGAGHIGLLTVLGSGRELVSVDVSPVASAFTRRNARANQMDELVTTVTGAMDAVVLEPDVFPLIVADPPYVPSAGVAAYPEDPVLAIDGGDDGLDLVRTTLTVVHDRLHRDGRAVLQLASEEQASQVEDWLRFGRRLAVDAVHLAERGALLVLRHDDPG